MTDKVVRHNLVINSSPPPSWYVFQTNLISPLMIGHEQLKLMTTCFCQGWFQNRFNYLSCWVRSSNLLAKIVYFSGPFTKSYVFLYYDDDRVYVWVSAKLWWLYIHPSFVLLLSNCFAVYPNYLKDNWSKQSWVMTQNDNDKPWDNKKPSFILILNGFGFYLSNKRC